MNCAWRMPGLEVYATPRRIVVIAREAASRQADEESMAKGPPADRAYDSEGNRQEPH